MSQRTSRILYAFRELVTTPTKRDEQVRIGPSDLGNQCDYCLAAKMAGEPVKRDFSMYPWLGSAIHKLVEWLTDKVRFRHKVGVNDLAWEVFGHPDARSELYMEECAFIPGYGWIPGALDWLLPGEGCIVDLKSTSRKKLMAYKANGVPIENHAQVLIYLEAVIRLGYNVDSAVLLYIPRDAAEIREFWAYEVQRNEEEARSVIDRAAVIYQWVELGRWRELESDPNCYACNPGAYRR